MTDDIPIGQRFSHVYLERGEPKPDSERMRRRLLEAAQSVIGLSILDIALIIRRDIGDFAHIYGDVTKYFYYESVYNILDIVTILWKVAFSKASKHSSNCSSRNASAWERMR